MFYIILCACVCVVMISHQCLGRRLEPTTIKYTCAYRYCRHICTCCVNTQFQTEIEIYSLSKGLEAGLECFLSKTVKQADIVIYICFSCEG